MRLPFFLRASTIFLVGLLSYQSINAAEPISEYKVKAAFLYNFTKLVTWPPNQLPSDGSLQVCVLGQDPFLGMISTMEKLDGKRFKYKVSYPLSETETGYCNLLFVSQSEKSSVSEITAIARRNSILTVSDIKGFASNGGVIEFVRTGNNLKFDINLAAARESNIKIEVKLLEVAERVIQ